MREQLALEVSLQLLATTAIVQDNVSLGHLLGNVHLALDSGEGLLHSRSCSGHESGDLDRRVVAVDDDYGVQEVLEDFRLVEQRSIQHQHLLRSLGLERNNFVQKHIFYHPPHNERLYQPIQSSSFGGIPENLSSYLRLIDNDVSSLSRRVKNPLTEFPY